MELRPRGRTDPRIAALVHDGLGCARTVLNVGADTGSYEPEDRHVLVVAPSAAMQAAMAVLTVHQWKNPAKDLGEVRWVARARRAPHVRRQALDRFSLGDHVQRADRARARRFPPIGAICSAGARAPRCGRWRFPIDCRDGFNEAFYARPERFLDDAVRSAQSG